ncbi:MAG: DUF1553 domain-containing protein [Planctomycetota bacterium]|nr:MAG: DUF1553 domain-containing protein [Planctomycetota bacterium]REK31180.1 MAG: DUF1553 domain-containing protein [Planctomycetota bacterium]
MCRPSFTVVAALLSSAVLQAADRKPDFESEVAPLLRSRCMNCHRTDEAQGELDLSRRLTALMGGESGAVIVPGAPDESLLIDYVSGDDPEMPKTGKPLTAEQIALLRDWIAAGAEWPETFVIEQDPRDWWSLRPLSQPAAPAPQTDAERSWIRNPIDAFIVARHREHGLTHSPEADRAILIRRLSYDLIGLPPTPEEVAAFVADPDPQAYERLVDRLLDSPRYGERWARHWLDVAHYGDTHGYDKDKLRNNAWPYRDYVIRSLNDDKPYADFIREQIAGDVLFPNRPEGIIATGFLAAGPWDFISHVEVPEEKIDGQIARSIDRDDMVRTVMETFCSVTVGCARCHEHKFDPVTQQDYYNLQAVFAAVDRADRPYDVDPEVHRRRQELLAQRQKLQEAKGELDAEIERLAGEELAGIDEQIARLAEQGRGETRPEFGYHSQIETTQNVTKWVQVDLGEPMEIEEIVYVGCHDDFNGIGAGFGFPVRFRIEAAKDAEFGEDVTTLVDETGEDFANPGVVPQRSAVPENVSARFVRVTATKLAHRKDDYIFALAELQVLTPDGQNAALGKEVTALDSIEAPVRWARANLVDGYYYGASPGPSAKPQIADLQEQRRGVIDRVLSPAQKQELSRVETQLAEVGGALDALPKPRMVYAATTQFPSQGNFHPTGGTPREIHVLHRGNILDPRQPAVPGALAVLDHGPSLFDLPESHTEGDRRIALANWVAHAENPLTWRSIVNRVWQHHFGRGLVDTPNDFGRMGETPTHPELIDWLAVTFRDGGGSLKALHRLICTSAVYRQSSVAAEGDANLPIDEDNRFLWRQNRRRLEAEAVRDAVLAVSGKLDLTPFGPGFQDFVIDKPEHSPHYQYRLHDPDDPRSHRRAVYRFVVRSQQQPFMTTLDCADPSMQVDKRNETVTPLQALAMLNNDLMVAMARHFAARLEAEYETTEERVAAGVELALSRPPSDEELTGLLDYTEKHGLENTCRVIFNLNEFVFVD